MARQVGEFMTWKQVECPFEEDRAILHYLHTAPIFSEDGENLSHSFHLQSSSLDASTVLFQKDLNILVFVALYFQVVLRPNLNNLTNPLTFHLVPLSGQIIHFS